MADVIGLSLALDEKWKLMMWMCMCTMMVLLAAREK
jgi:hypothetical protein